jgi:hypothetical protein
MKTIAAMTVALAVAASAPVASADAPPIQGPPIVRITPNTIHFGKQPVGTTSSIATATITNTSDATVHLCCFSIILDLRADTGNMDFQPNPCGTPQPGGIPLGPGESCTVTFVFQPINFPGWVIYEFCVATVESGFMTDFRSCITLTGMAV